MTTSSTSRSSLLGYPILTSGLCMLFYSLWVEAFLVVMKLLSVHGWAVGTFDGDNFLTALPHLRSTPLLRPPYLWATVIASTVMLIPVGVALVLAREYWRARRAPAIREEHLRGASLAASMEEGCAAMVGAERRLSAEAIRELGKRPLAEIIEAGRAAGMVRFGGAPMPRDRESDHGMLSGASGSGKSRALDETLEDLRRRGDRVVCFDNGAEFCRTHRRGGDIVFSPFYGKSPGWSLRNEVRQPKRDWPFVTECAIPDCEGSEKPWRGYARTMLAALGQTVGANSDNAELCRLMCHADPEELAIALQGTVAAGYCSRGGGEFLASIRGVAATHLSGWHTMKDGAFSLKSFMQSKAPAWLWLPYTDAGLAAARSLFGTWASILVSAGQNRPAHGLTTWIVIDELDALGRVGSLRDAVARLRKHRVRVVVGIQSRAQLIETYGQFSADGILASLSNRAYFGASDSSLTEWASKQIGEQEIDLTRRQRSQKVSSPDDASETHVTTRSMKRLVLPDELAGLDRGAGFVKFAGRNLVIPVRPRP